MGKKSRKNRQAKNKQAKIRQLKLKLKPVGIPAAWIGGLIVLLCLVGAWTHPAIANAKLLKLCTAAIVCSAFLPFWCIKNLTVTDISLRLTVSRLLFGGVFLLGCLSVLWTVNIDFFVYKWMLWFCGGLIFFFGLQLKPEDNTLSTLFHCLFIAGLSIALVGIAQYLFSYTGLPQAAPPSSTFLNKNMAAHVIVCTFPACLFLCLSACKSQTRIWFYTLGTALILVYLFYTITRAAWLAVAAESLGFLVFCLLDKDRREGWLSWNTGKTRATLVALVLGLVMVNYSSSGFSPFWKTVTKATASIYEDAGQTGAETETDTAPAKTDPRYIIWQYTVDMIKAAPLLGTGLGSFAANYRHYVTMTSMATKAHNDYLETVVELGGVGVLLLLAALISLGACVLRLLKHSQAKQRLAAAVMVCGLVGLGIDALFSSPLQMIFPAIIVALYTALLIRLSDADTPPLKQLQLKLTPPPRGAMAFIL